MRTLVALAFGGLFLFSAACSVQEPAGTPGGSTAASQTATPRTATPPTQTAAPQAATPLAGSPPASPQSPAPSPLAVGELTFDQLLQGILLLEKSPVPVTREQAVDLDQALSGKVPDFAKGEYLTVQATEILTPEQRESLTSDGQRVRPATEAQGRDLVLQLERLAGSEAPGQVTVPETPPPGSDKPAIPSIDVLATDPTAVEPPLTSEQARALLPVCRAYVALDTTIEEVLRSVLTEQQQQFIAARVDRGGAMQDDMEGLMQQVRKLVKERAKKS